MSTDNKNLQLLKGTITKISGEKTIKVDVETLNPHPRFQKVYKTTKRYLAHDEKAEGQVGDYVEIFSVRPLSARKRWMLGRIISKKQ